MIIGTLIMIAAAAPHSGNSMLRHEDFQAVTVPEIAVQPVCKETFGMFIQRFCDRGRRQILQLGRHMTGSDGLHPAQTAFIKEVDYPDVPGNAFNFNQGGNDRLTVLFPRFASGSFQNGLLRVSPEYVRVGNDGRKRSGRRQRTSRSRPCDDSDGFFAKHRRTGSQQNQDGQKNTQHSFHCFFSLLHMVCYGKICLFICFDIRG